MPDIGDYINHLRNVLGLGDSGSTPPIPDLEPMPGMGGRMIDASMVKYDPYFQRIDPLPSVNDQDEGPEFDFTIPASALARPLDHPKDISWHILERVRPHDDGNKHATMMEYRTLPDNTKQYRAVPSFSQLVRDANGKWSGEYAGEPGLDYNELIRIWAERGTKL